MCWTLLAPFPSHQPTVACAPSLPPLAPPPKNTQALKAAFTALMTAESDKVSGAISSLVARLNQEAEGGRALSDKERLVLRLNSQYPSDVGVLSAFFLNQVWGGGAAVSRQAGRPGCGVILNSAVWAAGQHSSWAGSRVVGWTWGGRAVGQAGVGGSAWTLLLALGANRAKLPGNNPRRGAECFDRLSLTCGPVVF